MDPSQMTSLAGPVRLHLKNHGLIFFECREGLVGFERRTGCQKNDLYGEYGIGLFCISVEGMNIGQFCPYLPLTGYYGTTSPIIIVMPTKHEWCYPLYKKLVKRIISGNQQLASFWGASHGWAPYEAAELMSKSRLDWQVELAETLYLWAPEKLNDGHLILAWANLGALIEGTLKLFLAIYYLDYKEDAESFKKRGKLVEPDSLALERLKHFFKKKNLLSDEQITHIELVQQRRNAIHAFKDRPIGTKTEYHECVAKYLELMIDINNSIPYPDSIYGPDF